MDAIFHSPWVPRRDMPSRIPDSYANHTSPFAAFHPSVYGPLLLRRPRSFGTAYYPLPHHIHPYQYPDLYANRHTIPEPQSGSTGWMHPYFDGVYGSGRRREEGEFLRPESPLENVVGNGDGDGKREGESGGSVGYAETIFEVEEIDVDDENKIDTSKDKQVGVSKVDKNEEKVDEVQRDSDDQISHSDERQLHIEHLADSNREHAEKRAVTGATVSNVHVPSPLTNSTSTPHPDRLTIRWHELLSREAQVAVREHTLKMKEEALRLENQRVQRAKQELGIREHQLHQMHYELQAEQRGWQQHMGRASHVPRRDMLRHGFDMWREGMHSRMPDELSGTNWEEEEEEDFGMSGM